MDATIPVTKLFFAFMILGFLSDCKGDHEDRSASFARLKWTLEGACQVVRGLIGPVFVYRLLFEERGTEIVEQPLAIWAFLVVGRT
jgi:hypothetical protein